MTQQISIDDAIANLKHATVPELQSLLDNVSAAIRSGTLRGQELEDAERYYDCIESEIRSRPLPSSLEEACGLVQEPGIEDLTWSPNALSEAERMIAEYCAAHGMSYAEFRKRVDAWLAQQAGEVESVADRLRKLVRNKDLRT